MQLSTQIEQSVEIYDFQNELIGWKLHKIPGLRASSETDAYGNTKRLILAPISSTEILIFGCNSFHKDLQKPTILP